MIVTKLETICIKPHHIKLCLITLRPRQHGGYFKQYFQTHFLHISLKFIPKGPINYNQWRIQDLRSRVAQMDWKIWKKGELGWKAGGGGGGGGADNIFQTYDYHSIYIYIYIYISITIYFKYDFLLQYCISKTPLYNIVLKILFEKF